MSRKSRVFKMFLVGANGAKCDTKSSGWNSAKVKLMLQQRRCLATEFEVLQSYPGPSLLTPDITIGVLAGVWGGRI